MAKDTCTPQVFVETVRDFTSLVRSKLPPDAIVEFDAKLSSNVSACLEQICGEKGLRVPLEFQIQRSLLRLYDVWAKAIVRIRITHALAESQALELLDLATEVMQLFYRGMKYTEMERFCYRLFARKLKWQRSVMGSRPLTITGTYGAKKRPDDLSIQEAAEVLHLSVPHTRRLARATVLAITKDTRPKRVSRRSVEAYLNNSERA